MKYVSLVAVLGLSLASFTVSAGVGNTGHWNAVEENVVTETGAQLSQQSNSIQVATSSFWNINEINVVTN